MGTAPELPDLRAGGLALWKAFGAGLSEPQRVVLLEACRAKDRLDQLDRVLSADVDVWARLVHRLQTQDYELRIDDALAKANTTATSLRGLLSMLPADSTEKPKAANALDELKNRRESRGAAPAGKSGTASGRK